MPSPRLAYNALFPAGELGARVAARFLPKMRAAVDGRLLRGIHRSGTGEGRHRCGLLGRGVIPSGRPRNPRGGADGLRLLRKGRGPLHAQTAAASVRESASSTCGMIW